LAIGVYVAQLGLLGKKKALFTLLFFLFENYGNIPYMTDKPKLYTPEFIDWDNEDHYSKAARIKTRWKSISRWACIGGDFDFPTAEARNKIEEEAKQAYYGYMQLFMYYHAIENSDYAKRVLSDEDRANEGNKYRNTLNRHRERELEASKGNYQIAASFYTHRIYDKFRKEGLDHENSYNMCDNIIRETIISFRELFRIGFPRGDAIVSGPVDRRLLHSDIPPKNVSYLTVLGPFGQIPIEETERQRPLSQKQDLEKLCETVNTFFVSKARIY
jgi:hypothetical protein